MPSVYFPNAGSISNRYFRYQDEEYIFITMIHYTPIDDEPFSTSLSVAPVLSGSEGVLEKGAVVFAGTVLPLRDAKRFVPDSSNYVWSYPRTHFSWEGPECLGKKAICH